MKNGTILDKRGCMINLYKGYKIGQEIYTFLLYFTTVPLRGELEIIRFLAQV